MTDLAGRITRLLSDYFIGARRRHVAEQIAEMLAPEIAALKEELITFLVLWATHYQEMQMLDGLHPQHFDRLKELGARIDDFKRANITKD